jgi:predicted O-linked N-acetylglucosamine transferase (SPINDLY family)
LIVWIPTIGQHLEFYQGIDVALDTTPYTGTTTTCEALWMGVPVVTLLGDRHCARVSASLLAAAGFPEWVADSPETYVRIAADLGRRAAQRAELRVSLRERMANSILLDHAGQARRFGEALRACWRQRSAQPEPTPEAAVA